MGPFLCLHSFQHSLTSSSPLHHHLLTPAPSLPSVPTTEPVVEEEEELHLPEVPEGKPKEKERRKEKVAVAAT